MTSAYKQRRTRQPLGLPGIWTLPMPAPRVFGHLGRDGEASGLFAGTLWVGRISANPVTGEPRESTMALLERAAQVHGTQEGFTYAYPDDSDRS
jgi:hypothetical protein